MLSQPTLVVVRMHIQLTEYHRPKMKIINITLTHLSHSRWLLIITRTNFGQRCILSIMLTLQQLMASSCRQKILVALSKVKETHVTNLVRMINSTYNQVDRNLLILEKEGIIRTNRYGRGRFIGLNRDSPRTIVLLKVLEALDKSTDR
jgi:DNA-binding transcriptional ArsR family regulator